MELHELEVSECRAREIGRGHPLSDRAWRIRGALPKRRSTASGEQRGASGDGATVGHDAYTPLFRSPEREHLLALGYLDSWMRESSFGEHASHAIAGRGAARVHHASAAMSALEAEPVIELDTELDEIANSCRCLFGQCFDGACTAESSACAKRVLGMEHRRVVSADCRSDAALGEQAIRGQEWSLGENEDVTLGGRAQRRNEPGDAPTDDDEIKCF